MNWHLTRLSATDKRVTTLCEYPHLFGVVQCGHQTRAQARAACHVLRVTGRKFKVTKGPCPTLSTAIKV